MTKHTPPPWQKFIDLQRDTGQIIWDPTDNHGPALIITAGVSGRSKEEALANLCLFSAAPDLLAACEFAIDCLAPHMDMAHDMLEEAITKARGTNSC